ncbi:hypothetical protein BaRGS_00005885 [Batillaria attramentaria]|uniref:Uncharacterized protein n=1 Tax=Batillaria attramentaria TaxID=370345 RepID=A0ABD0LV31_9CAEN
MLDAGGVLHDPTLVDECGSSHEVAKSHGLDTHPSAKTREGRPLLQLFGAETTLERTARRVFSLSFLLQSSWLVCFLR